MKRLTSVALALFAVASMNPAAADQSTFRDGDEQPFCMMAGPTPEQDPCPDDDYLDFRSVSHGHGERPRRVRHGLRTSERWRSRDLDGRHGVSFVFDFDTDGRRDVDVQLRVRKKDGRLRAYLYEGEYFGRHIPGEVRVWRPGRRSLKVGFSADLLREGIDSYRWRVHWWNRNVACPGSCHTDYAPDRGWYEHSVR